jgi:hypothetical protein
MPRAAAKPSFEIADVNRVLPLVRSIVTDIVASAKRFREIEAERRALRSGPATPNSPATVAAIAALKAELEERSAQTQEYVRELTELGGDIKDYERGLVDFECERGGRTVLLCWELGETEVTHWHGADENFFDRRPISTLPPADATRSRTESGGSKRAREGGSSSQS